VFEQCPPLFRSKGPRLSNLESADPEWTHPHANEAPNRESQHEQAPPDLPLLPFG